MFRDRNEAALRLAKELKGRTLHDPLVLAIPRGGLAIGAVLARELQAELDVVLSRKLRAPRQPELAIGAVSEAGQMFLHDRHREALGVSEAYLAQERSQQLAEIARRKSLFRRFRPPASIVGRSIIITDDGIATGSTMIAALQMLQTQSPHDVVVAVPVAPRERLSDIRHWCDELVCLHAAPDFFAIGQFYEDFSQLDDAQIVDILRGLPSPRQAVAAATGQD